jgi:uncharacterized protein YndB with AHSA1/START domain
MDMSAHEINMKIVIQAPVGLVYQAFTNATALREWLCDVATVDPKPGGRLYLYWNSGYYTVGEFVKVLPDQEVTFTWRGRGELSATRVWVAFTEKDGRTTVTLLQNGVGLGEDWKHAFEEIQHGWDVGLKNLVSVLETGEDLRITKRPMLGIFIGDFNEKRAAELGTPVKAGVRLDGVMEGLGAKAAGLQKDDVIVEMNGKPAVDFNMIGACLQGCEAGDKVEVVFYRGSEKKQAMMKLSSRPIPLIPDSVVKLAEAVKANFREGDAALEKCLEGVSEEESKFHPKPGEWNVIEVLAHLTQGNRFFAFYIADLIASQERVADGFGDNIDAFIHATAAAYPTLAEMVSEFKKSRIELVQFLTELPEEFFKRKRSNWRLAYEFLQPDLHILEHVEQIKKIVETARKR